MKILIAGGTGLVGTALVKELSNQGYDVRVLVRKPSRRENTFLWDYKNEIIDEKAFDGISCIINLTGANIGKRWTESYKEEIRSSRVDSTRFLYEKCLELGVQLDSLISASGVNYYGTFTSNHILTEENEVFHYDFLSKICKAWEEEAQRFENIARRVVILRTSPVLSKKEGSFTKLKHISDYHLSSGLGKGTQWFNWVHLEDLVAIYIEAVRNPQMTGAYNAVADEISTQSYFMKYLAKTNKKLFIPFNIPVFVLRCILGEMSEIMLEGTRVSNAKIKTLGFRFKYPDLKSALEELISVE